MPLPQAKTEIPTAIGNIRITLTDYVTITDGATYEVEVIDQNGNIMISLNGDLMPHLTSGQITQLQAFMAAMRTKAENEILP